MTDIDPTAETQSLEEQLLGPTYRIEPEPFWTIARMRGDCGYDIMEPASAHGWQPISGWGRDGWNMGSWPYVVMYHRRTADAWQVAYYVEGDLTIYSYPDRELCLAGLDCLALWHWKHDGEEWAAGIDRVEDAPGHLRGAYSSKRLDAEKAS